MSQETRITAQARAIDNESLVLDMIEWIARQPRSYADVMDAWRTSCPRLAVWEAAVELQLVARVYRKGEGATVHVTSAGHDLLVSRGRSCGSA
jgi:hypothetical protein